MNISHKSPDRSLSYCSIDIGEDCRTAQADFDGLLSAAPQKPSKSETSYTC